MRGDVGIPQVEDPHGPAADGRETRSRRERRRDEGSEDREGSQNP